MRIWVKEQLSCSVPALTRPSSQVHPQRDQLALHQEALRSAAPASNLGPQVTRVRLVRSEFISPIPFSIISLKPSRKAVWKQQKCTRPSSSS